MELRTTRSMSLDSAVMPTFNPTSEAALNNTFFTKPTNSTSAPPDKAFSIYIVMVVWLSFFFAGVAGNVLVCVTVHKNQNMQTPVNTLLVNLAVADIYFSVASVLAIADFSIKDPQVGELSGYYDNLMSAL